MKSINLLIFAIILLVMGCENNSNKRALVTHSQDYNHYLEVEKNEIKDAAQQDYIFWEEKLEKEPNQFPYLVKAAASQSLLFNQTGDINHLIQAEKSLIKANEATNYTNSSYLRSLSRNYISQHKFKQALGLLKIAEANGDKLKATQKMLFDVHLELGNTEIAKQYLSKIENPRDFDYLIRLSKWSDHEGHLDDAIMYLKNATLIAEATKNTGLIQWAYTNLADYYGHAGEIEASYRHYLKALEINPHDAYAKKGIAWIVYSYEKNPDEALRVLNAITKKHNVPDYHLLIAEIAEFKGDLKLKEIQLELYNNAVDNNLYGAMYNKYNVLLLAENFKKTEEALKIAKEEIKNRPTAQSYDLLAWSHYNQGNIKVALEVMENHVVGKTFEPEVLYHLAKIYKANGMIDMAKTLKKELLESTFELGPITAKKVKEF